MEWLKNLSRAIDYIENNLDKTISYEEAAKIACCSTCYFQRMFSYAAGISLAEYIRRRRMTQAAFELQSTDKRVLEIALQFGYTYPTSFNRAFQAVHGSSPTAVKNRCGSVNAYLPMRFSVQVTGESAMPYRMEEKGAMRVVGVRTPLTADMEHNRTVAPLFWEKILRSGQFRELSGLANQTPRGLLGITACQSPDRIDYYIATATDKPVPQGMHEFWIPSATWVVFESTGSFKEAVQEVFCRFLTEWLPFSGYTYAELPDIEVYPFGEDSQNGKSEVWIAIKKEKE